MRGIEPGTTVRIARPLLRNDGRHFKQHFKQASGENANPSPLREA
jgi:hypothetical protein